MMAGDNAEGSGSNRPRGAVGGNSRRRRRRTRKRGPKRPTSGVALRGQPAAVGLGRARLARAARAAAKRVLRDEGPRAAVGQRAAIAIGQVKTNTSGGVEVEITVPVNPLLMRETSGPNTVGPIQMLASSYSLWRLRWVKVFLKPLVGGSAVSGTIVRVSLNQSGEPGQNNWSGLGARRHIDVTPGKHGVFTLEARDIPGMRQGWFDTNPNGGMGKAIGGTLEVHTYGRTVSTYQAKAFDGPLFLVEVMCHWDFANFQSQPGLLQMEVGTQTSEQSENERATIDAKAGGPIDILVDEKSKLGIATGKEPAALARVGGERPGNTIWMIVDSAVSASTAIFPPPFSWLASAGWWFVKRIFGAPVASDGNTKVRLRVYQNFEDAQNNRPCIATTNAGDGLVNTEWTFYQLTGESTGLSPAQPTPVPVTILPDVPLAPVTGSVRVMGEQISYEPVDAQNFASIKFYVTEPTSAVLGNGDVGLQVGSTFRPASNLRYLKDPLMIQKQDVGVVPVDINQIQRQASVVQKKSDVYYPVAGVYATSMVQFGPSGQPDGWLLQCYCVAEVQIDYQWQRSGKVWANLVCVQPDPATQQGDSSSTGLIPKPVLVTREMSWLTGAPKFTISKGAHFLMTIMGQDKNSANQIPFEVPYGTPTWARPSSATVTPITKFPQHAGLLMSPDFLQMNIVVGQSRLAVIPEESDEGDVESTDEEDCAGDWDTPPRDVLHCFSEEGKKMERRLRKVIFDETERALAVQAARPSRPFQVFKASYQGYLLDGCSPPTARDAAVEEARELIEAQARMTDGSGARSQLSSWSDFN